MTTANHGTGAAMGRITLLVKAARMYHEEGILQPEIADRLNISQSRVSRLLKEAQRLGIVRTVVVAPPGVYAELEQQVRTTFGLQDVVIADAASDDDPGVLSALGPTAAAYIQETLRAGERIGISSRSASLLAMVEALAPITAGPAEVVVQTLGAVGNPAMRAQAPRLTDRLAQLTGGEPIYLPTPGVVTSRAVRDGLLADPYIADAVRAWQTLSVLITGIGSAQPSAQRPWGTALPAEDLDQLTDLNAVGDVCLNFFTADGLPVRGPISDRVIGIGADELRAIPRRIAVAGGSVKVPAIGAAARGGWINVLITDQFTARRLLED
ncbi:sugar-binding transcriptional regulator [Microlunatus soli]|uniref:DNA-binding transcriptional regulator LsrR, DeoR family n=1 Tax=Microlunatus soli TaxID=630515 RepID=A0A1H1ZRK6_9ACTN|nr:sugar-binding transcriptional regulator [Microlunatus soli]SDT36358.1 DNA-binding transcriptional regulator LsrR, DeoR family [Microlunatus soli]